VRGADPLDVAVTLFALLELYKQGMRLGEDRPSADITNAPRAEAEASEVASEAFPDRRGAVVPVPGPRWWRVRAVDAADAGCAGIDAALGKARGRCPGRGVSCASLPAAGPGDRSRGRGGRAAPASPSLARQPLTPAQARCAVDRRRPAVPLEARDGPHRGVAASRPSRRCSSAASAGVPALPVRRRLYERRRRFLKRSARR